MKIKIVTDSTADLDAGLARQIGIEVVPAYIWFGDRRYRDRVDMTEDEFYFRLLSATTPPRTEPPTPHDFAQVYSRLSSEADAVVSIHISSKLSSTVNSAMRGKELLNSKFPIEVIDSQLVTMGLGLLVISANDLNNPDIGLIQLVDEVKRTIPSITMLGYLDTLKYLALGGRIGKARALIGSLLNTKPILTMKDGELEPAGVVRNHAAGMEKLLDVVTRTPGLEDVAVVYSTTPDEARSIAERIKTAAPVRDVRITRLGPVLGVHTGPGIIFVALRAKKPLTPSGNT